MSTLVNHIAILLDRSGSMSALADGVIKQYNQQAAHIAAKSEQTGQKTYLSLYTFSDQADKPFLIEAPLDLVALKPLDRNTYRPDGMTAMLDSVGMAVTQLSQFERGVGDSFLCICITDGEENASLNHGWQSISSLIKNRSATDRWTFVFLVPRGKKQMLIQRLGVYEGNVQEWDQTVKGVEEYTRATTAGLDNYFQARQTGKTATRGFFTDLSNVTTAQVKTVLQDATDRFRRGTIMTADCDHEDAKGKKCVRVDDYCRKYFGDFHEGLAYYSLTKSEKVQHGKRVVIEDRKSGKLYSGDQARTLLGLPLHGDINVKPGDHGTYTIYIQSTSNNRNLIEGQTVLYYQGVPVGA